MLPDEIRRIVESFLKQACRYGFYLFKPGEPLKEGKFWRVPILLRTGSVHLPLTAVRVLDGDGSLPDQGYQKAKLQRFEQMLLRTALSLKSNIYDMVSVLGIRDERLTVPKEQDTEEVRSRLAEVLRFELQSLLTGTVGILRRGGTVKVPELPKPTREELGRQLVEIGVPIEDYYRVLPYLLSSYAARKGLQHGRLRAEDIRRVAAAYYRTLGTIYEALDVPVPDKYRRCCDNTQNVELSEDDWLFLIPFAKAGEGGTCVLQLLLLTVLSSSLSRWQIGSIIRAR